LTPDYQIDHEQGSDFFYVTNHKGDRIAVSWFALPRLTEDLLRLCYPNLPLWGGHTVAAPDADVDALARLGREWTKPGRRGRDEIQRIYFDPLHGWYGLLIRPDRTAAFRGQPCSNEDMHAIHARFLKAKVYFDVLSKTFHGTQIGQEDFEFIVEQIRTLERSRPDDPR